MGFDRRVCLFPQLPESYSGCCGHIERVNLVVHGYADGIVGLCYGGVRQSVAFGAHDDGQAWLTFQYGIIERDGIIAQCHGGGQRGASRQRL